MLSRAPDFTTQQRGNIGIMEIWSNGENTVSASHFLYSLAHCSIIPAFQHYLFA
jgi:hypothetical protein